MCMSVHVIERIQVGNRGCALAQEGEKEACVSKQESECTSECVKRQRKRESVCVWLNLHSLHKRCYTESGRNGSRVWKCPKSCLAGEKVCV